MRNDLRVIEDQMRRNVRIGELMGFDMTIEWGDSDMVGRGVHSTQYRWCLRGNWQSVNGLGDMGRDESRCADCVDGVERDCVRDARYTVVRAGFDEKHVD